MSSRTKWSETQTQATGEDETGGLRNSSKELKGRHLPGRQEAVEAWTNIARGLSASDDPADRALAQGVEQYVRSMPFVRTRGLTFDKVQPWPEINVDRGPSREVVPGARSQERER